MAEPPAEIARKPVEMRQQALQEELRQLADVVGAAQLVDLLLERCFQIRATDIHFDPTAQGLRVRIRVDGLLHDIVQFPPEASPQIISRLKLMADMDITERRLAQDGHISNAAISGQRDIRVGSGPTIYGERLVLRLMPDSKTLTRLEELGLDDSQVAAVKQAIGTPYGMVLSVGPVGSGKSTTVYACLELLNDPSKSVVTIEDPVERRIDGINQIQIEPRIDFNFVNALRGVLRQDPNVMMIGEIRDPETAHIGCRAGLTGIVVLSTLHAKDAAAAVDVFREFGIPSMFIADSLQAVISQRLVRRICQHCKTTYRPDEATCHFLKVEPHRASEFELVRAVGCDACFQTGYQGRTGIFEILTIDRDIRQAILHGKSHDELRAMARERGMQSLEDAARKKVLSGVTSIEEMHRVMTVFET